MPNTFLKPVRDDASSPLAERPFQVLAPLKEKDFWPVLELSLGSLKSVSVLLKHPEVGWDALVNRLPYIEGLIQGGIYKPWY